MMLSEILEKKSLQIKRWFNGPSSQFKVGDSVQMKEGGDIMVVTSIVTNSDMEEPLVFCKWFDTKAQTNRSCIFSESALREFDWYNAQKADQ